MRKFACNYCLDQNSIVPTSPIPPHQSAIIVTSCTNRKKNTGEVITLPECGHAPTIEELAREWIASLAAAKQLETVLDLYQGRSFAEAKRAAKAATAQLYVASAGHGLVRSDQLLPSYNLTVAASPKNALHLTLTRLGKTPADWWQALTRQVDRPRSISALMNDSTVHNYNVLLAMPSAYLTMLSHDLANLSDQQITRLRIITSEFGAAQLSERLRPTVMPYDERLEGSTSYTGTRNDFAQRALRHFIVELGGHALPLNVAHAKVGLAMEALTKPVQPQRARRSDVELEEIILQNWHNHNGSQSALLRHLRDKLLVSCEQGRFRLLWQRVRSTFHDDK
jgi:hypothetical protein